MPKAKRQKKRAKGKTRSRYRVFLSHSHHDLWLATVIANRLRKRGIGVWLDEMSLAGGSNILDEITRGIEETHETVVLSSPEALKSHWVSLEVGIAKGRRKRVTQLLNNVDSNAFPPLRGVKSYELNAFDKFVGELCKRAKALRRP